MSTRPWMEIRDSRPETPGRRQRVEEAEAEMARQEEEHRRSLAELRRARRVTQVQLAKVLDVSQAQVSRIKHQADLYLSTLRSYVEAMGGELQLAAVFLGARVELDILDTPELASQDPETSGHDPEADAWTWTALAPGVARVRR